MILFPKYLLKTLISEKILAETYLTTKTNG